MLGEVLRLCSFHLRLGYAPLYVTIRYNIIRYDTISQIRGEENIEQIGRLSNDYVEIERTLNSAAMSTLLTLNPSVLLFFLPTMSVKKIKER